MADNEIKAEIIFENNDMMEVQNTVVEITSQIEGQKNLALPMVNVADADGNEIWIKANNIRMIKDV